MLNIQLIHKLAPDISLGKDTGWEIQSPRSFSYWYIWNLNLKLEMDLDPLDFLESPTLRILYEAPKNLSKHFSWMHSSGQRPAHY